MWFVIGLLCWLALHLVLGVAATFSIQRYFRYYREKRDVDLPVFPERRVFETWWRPVDAFRLERRYLQILFRRQSGQDVEQERRRAIRPLKLDLLCMFVGLLLPVLGAALDKYLS